MNDIFINNYNEYLKYCYNLTKHNEEAEDLLHDVYLKLHKYQDRYSNNITKNMVFVVIKNMFLDNWRKTKDIYFVDDYVLQNLEADVSKLLKLRYRVVEVASKLSEIEHNILLDERSMRKISRESGVTMRKIKTIVDNAKQKFKEEWLKEENLKD